MQLDGKKALDNIYLKPGNSYAALAVSADPDRDKLNWRWEVVPEPTQLSEGGDFEARPKPVEGLIKTTGEGKVTLSTPAKEGAYRLFVYITDGHNNVATANIPFYVKP